MENEQELLHRIGIEIDQNRVTIDLKKTKSFFTALQETLRQKAEQLQKNMEEGRLKMDEIGLKLDEERVEVDLQKTKTFIETFEQKINSFLQELDSSVRKLNEQK